MTAHPGAGLRLLAADLDGTLVDSAPDLNHCLGVALASVGLPRPTEAATRSWIGDGVEVLIQRALEHAASDGHPEPTFRAAHSAFAACYAQNLFERSRLYPRVLETLDALASRGVRLCCVTNKRLAFANGVLERAGLADRFELVLGGDSLPRKKPSPAQLEAASERTGIAPAAAALVGDSHHDFAAARAGGWAFIWARYGYCPRIDFEQGEPLAAIDAFAELDELLKERAG